MNFEQAFLKLKPEHKDVIVAIIHAAAARPNSIPAFIVLADNDKHELQAIPIGKYEMRHILKMCKMIADPTTTKFERTIFTGDLPEN